MITLGLREQTKEKVQDCYESTDRGNDSISSPDSKVAERPVRVDSFRSSTGSSFAYSPTWVSGDSVSASDSIFFRTDMR